MSEQDPCRLPETIGEIDRDWLTAALRQRAPRAAVRRFEILDVIHGTSTKVRLGLDLEQDPNAPIPPTVILKGGFEPHSRGMDFMYLNEVRFYRDVQPLLDLQTPACYFADTDPDGWQSLIIMEDLRARGVRFLNALQPSGYDEVERRLISLAQYHAKTWDSLDLAPGGRFDWLADRMPSIGAMIERDLEPTRWRHFVVSPRGAAVSIRFHDHAWMRDALARLTTLSATLPACVIHGDTHPGNLYIDHDGTPGYFDSLPGRAPWEVEVSYHITCALDLADRRRWEEPLVRRYLDELACHGIAVPDLADALRRCAMFLAYGYFIFMVNESFFQTEATNTAYTARFSAAMLDHDTIGLLASV